MKQLIIVGASGHGEVVSDIAMLNGYTDIAFLDDDETVGECNAYPVLGRIVTAPRYPKADFIVAIGNANARERIQNLLIENGLNVVSLVHPKAVVAKHVDIGVGSVVMAGVVINTNTVIGRGCIINTCASVDHDCCISGFVHVSVGAHIAGGVDIGLRTWIGIGAAVVNNIVISRDCMIGAGAVVIDNIVQPGTYVGVPARRI